ncbi:SDR family oxidoreductase [Lysobacter cavernae]|uniref:SDR family oxidoreductase n=1 Tax=Lysobacter cavernae TaxID=1685901 RepID=A0ABV7RQ89_9GAMM
MSQRWLVTGAGRGLGRAITQQLLARGDHVAATVRQLDALDDLARQHPDRLIVRQLDMADHAAIRATVDEAVAALGGLDVVASNAGYALVGAAEEASDEQIAAHLSVNLLGPIHLIRAALPHLRRQGHGRIVQVSSENGQMSLPALSCYQAAKWGIEGYCESVAQEVAPLGIQMIIVEPGRIATAFDRSSVPAQTQIDDYQRTSVGNLLRLHAMGRLPRLGDPQRMAQAIIACADSTSPPLRLLLGSDAWRNVERALHARMAVLDGQRESAAATDIA